MALRTRLIFIFLSVAIAFAIDDIDVAASNSVLLKALREMTNQTKADSLNLPANATSIRENITDTFSCENRTYGYYADIDNECQVFHVCLPSQTPAGRNVTYRWSFICPKETIFNQEVLTCTYPRDAIDCKDSEMFYHVNMEIGKEPEKTDDKDKTDKDNKTDKDKKDKDKKTDKKEKERRTNNRKDNRKQNIILESDFNDINEEIKQKLEEFNLRNGENTPMLLEAVVENPPEVDTEELDRIMMESNMRNAREMRRGAFRFTGDV